MAAPLRRPPRPFTPTEIAEIRRLEAECLSSKEIAARIGRAESSVRVKLMEIAILDEIAEDGEGRMRRDKSKSWRPVWSPN